MGEPEGAQPTKIVVIAGPTGVGKSAIAVELGVRFQGEIINADCMQVYKGLDIGTAKPSKEEMAKVPHHLFDIVDPDEPFNAGRFKEMADQKIQEITSRGRLPLIVGGTGLYIRALLRGLVELNSSKDREIRETIRQKDSQWLYDELKKLDPEAAKRIHPNDKVRLIRALELYSITRRPPSELWMTHAFGQKRYNSLCLFLYTERRLLYQRINERCEEMVRSGLVEEVRGLLDRYPPDLKPLRSIGYRHMRDHIVFNKSLDICLEQFKRDTRRYAKRQFIWFRKEPDFLWVRAEEKDRIFFLVHQFKEGLNA